MFAYNPYFSPTNSSIPSMKFGKSNVPRMNGDKEVEGPWGRDTLYSKQEFVKCLRVKQDSKVWWKEFKSMSNNYVKE